MSQAQCWGIFREREHSPGRESDDAEILRLTGKHLEAHGFEVILKSPDEMTDPSGERPEAVFVMCEQLPVLRRLLEWEAIGVRQVNRPRAILNTYRESMIARFVEAAVPFIPSRVVSTIDPPDAIPGPAWVKRADVHNTQDGDVVFAPTREAIRAALGGLAERGIPRGVIQPPIAGDLIKFYGIGTDQRSSTGRPWFRWFYHKDQNLAGHPLDPERLVQLAGRAAAALGLEVFGGDVIARETGELVLLDVNAWPSFALYRDEAAPAIASYLTQQFSGGRS